MKKCEVRNDHVRELCFEIDGGVFHYLKSAPFSKSRMPLTDRITRRNLEDAYKEARIRLQMAQTSLLFRYNDDDRRIFSELRDQLAETYEKLK